jgi:hypothetical protein
MDTRLGVAVLLPFGARVRKQLQRRPVSGSRRQSDWSPDSYATTPPWKSGNNQGWFKPSYVQAVDPSAVIATTSP